jgi:hypothetical protein
MAELLALEIALRAIVMEGGLARLEGDAERADDRQDAQDDDEECCPNRRAFRARAQRV